jgi:hypothetical protein
MAYSKVSNKSQNKDVQYLSKDFNSFREQLINFAEVYFPDTFQDFSEGTPGMMFIEMASYIGDILSFYTDKQLQESFIDLAQNKENLYNLAYAMGYVPRVTAASSVELDIYQLVPSIFGTEYRPDYNYALNIQPNSTFISGEGTSFYTTDQVNFSTSGSIDPTTVSIYQYDDNNNPEYYLLKKKVSAISAEVKERRFDIGGATQFLTLDLFDTNIISIESIKDSDGNIYTEVPYLAQDIVFDEVENIASNDPALHGFNQQTPYLLKVKKVPRRFVSRVRSSNHLEIQFGAGNSDNSDNEILPNPDNIGLGIKDGRSKLNVAYDPSNFLFSKAYGQIPTNTTLIIRYLKGGGLRSNVSANTITQRGVINMITKPNLNVGLVNYIKSTVTSNNPLPAVGGGSGDSIEDIRLNTIANFSSQHRTVTKEDYLVRTLSMPSRFGRVAKAYITQDDQISPLTSEPGRVPNPLALNLYVLGYDSNKRLVNLNNATKTNLQNYLEQHRTLTDAVNIKNAFVINFSVQFEIITFKSYSNQEVLLNVITELKDYFSIDKWQINQPIIISEIYNLIGGVDGVQSVEDVQLENKFGTADGYSQYKYDFNQATRKGVIYPSLDPSIFELKIPNTDIEGRVTTY